MNNRFTYTQSFLSLLACGLFLANANHARADGILSDEYVNPGAYIVMGGVTGFSEFKDIPATFDTSLGFMLRGGYRIDSIFAIEAGGNFLSGWDTQAESPAPGSQGGLTLDGGTATVNALAYLPLGRFQPHLLVGLGGMWAQLRTTDSVVQLCGPDEFWFCQNVYRQLDHSGSFVMKFGGGLDAYITRDWALVIDAAYVLPFGDLKDLRYVSLNWGIRFNF